MTPEVSYAQFKSTLIGLACALGNRKENRPDETNALFKLIAQFESLKFDPAIVHLVAGSSRHRATYTIADPRLPVIIRTTVPEGDVQHDLLLGVRILAELQEMNDALTELEREVDGVLPGLTADR